MIKAKKFQLGGFSTEENKPCLFAIITTKTGGTKNFKNSAQLKAENKKIYKPHLGERNIWVDVEKLGNYKIID